MLVLPQWLPLQYYHLHSLQSSALPQAWLSASLLGAFVCIHFHTLTFIKSKSVSTLHVLFLLFPGNKCFIDPTTQLLQFFDQNLLTMFIVRSIFQQVNNSFLINYVACIVQPFFIFIFIRNLLFPIEASQKIIPSFLCGIHKLRKVFLEHMKWVLGHE